ncbi:MAG: SAM hydrolase/SAM-dependent halogenase family protein [Promethearchaeota archaeon]
MRKIGILTDFGTKAGYVASMKGVISSLSDVEIMDLSHGITPHAILEAALFLDNCVLYFPEKFIFLVVVDPGVGSSRRIVAIKTRARGQYFIAPDNGILDLVIKEQGVDVAISLTIPHYWRETASHTFHGRDIMAPVAAHIANGIALEKMGDLVEVGSLESLEIPGAKYLPESNSVLGCTLYCDEFGNVVTNIREEDLGMLNISPSSSFHVTILRDGVDAFSFVAPFEQYYSEVNPGEYLCLFNSENRFEISINQGNAAKMLGIMNPLEKIRVRLYE